MKPKLLSFHVYETRYPRRPADPKWCVASVHSGGRGLGFHQCRRKPKHEYGGHGWCPQHYPPNVEARRQERYAERLADSAAWNRRRQEAEVAEKQQIAAMDAIRQIAAGHNDPRSLAQEVLAMVPVETAT